jgi:predicted transcriptional regulator
MGYQEELQARLDAVRQLDLSSDENKKVSTEDLERQISSEIESEFEFSQYDLDESDILRAIKINSILQQYSQVFERKNALRVFYALAKIDVIHAKNLYPLCELSSTEFKQLINIMAKHELVHINEDKEIELTLQGQSLAERIGMDVFI